MAYIEPLVDQFSDLPAAIKKTSLRVAIANNNMTPSRGFIAGASKYTSEKQTSLDVFVNANKENSIFNDSEIKIMEDDLFQCQELGVDGVIIGATTTDKKIDQEAMEILAGASSGMEMFFGPAFDIIPEQNWDESIKWLTDHNFSGIVASKKLSSLQKRLSEEASIRFIPITKTNKQLNEAKEKLDAKMIINKK